MFIDLILNMIFVNATDKTDPEIEVPKKILRNLDNPSWGEQNSNVRVYHEFKNAELASI